MVSVAYMDPSKVLLSDAQSFLDTETTGNMSSKNYKVLDGARVPDIVL